MSRADRAEGGFSGVHFTRGVGKLSPVTLTTIFRLTPPKTGLVYIISTPISTPQTFKRDGVFGHIVYIVYIKEKFWYCRRTKTTFRIRA